MTDLATQGPPGATPGQDLPPQTTPTTNPSRQIIDGLTTATRAAPELRTNPGAAVAVAQKGGDVGGNAQVVAHVANARAVQTAHNQLAQTHPDTLHQILGFFSHTYHSAVHDLATTGKDIGHGLNVVGHIANAPLNYVQHEYRYLHDVVARHGALAGALEGLGIAAGAIALGVATGGIGDVALGGALGGALGAGSGAVLGGEAAAGIEGKVAYKDSWARTTNGATYRDPNTGQPVSFGRDVAGVVGLRPGTGSYRFVSGVGDALGDLSLDPLGHVGRIIGAARSAEGAHGLLGLRYGGLAPQGNTAVQAAEDVSRVYDQYPSVQRAFADIAHSTPGEIVAKYPQLATGGPNGESDAFLLARLGAAHTPDQVKAVFEEAVRTHELTQTAVLPTLTGTRELAFRATDALANANVPVLSKATQVVRKLPAVYDPEAQKFTREEFSPTDDYGANAVYKMLLFGEKPEVARSVASAYLNEPTVAGRVAIYRNAVTSTLAAMARNQGADVTEEDMRQIGARIDELTRAAEPNIGGVYGMDATGHDISRVVDPQTGKVTAAAITPNQVGKLALPNFTAMKRVATELAGGKTLFGKADDWLYDHVTQGIFKRLVLLTGGFAARVALSEDIPNSLRLGMSNLVKNRLLASAIRKPDDEAGLISHYLWNVMGKTTSPAKADFMVRLADATDGHMVSPGLSAEHNLGDELAGPVEDAGRSLRRAVNTAPDKFKATDEFATYNASSSQDNFARAWQAELSENASQEPSRLAAEAYLGRVKAGDTPGMATVAAEGAVKDWLDAQPERWLQTYERHTLKSPDADPGATPHEDWSKVLVRKVLGSVTGDDGTLHSDLLERIASGGKFDRADLASRERVSWPTQVKGRVYVPDVTGGIARLANVGFRRVLNPMINWLSREPFYTEEAYRQWRLLAPQVERGELDADQAMTLAMTRATNKAIRFVHNLNERTQVSETLRNWAPFYFAQEQAYKRVFRLLGEDPGAFRRYQMMLGAVHNIGAQKTDAQGNNYFVYPGTGWLSAGTIGALGKLGIPVVGSNVTSFSANLSSAGVMFPFAEGVRPDIGPVVALPVKAIADLFEGKVPWLNQASAATLGGITANEAFWQAAIPNSFLQRVGDLVASSLTSGDQGTVSFNSTFMHTLQALAMEGRVPPENAGPAEMQTFLDRVRNQTTINYAVRAALGLIVPISPQVRVKDWGLPTELQTEITKAGSATAGIQAFLAKNPDATPYTVFESAGQTGGYLPDTKAALDWVTQNRSLVEKYPYAAAWLMPQSAAAGPYDAAAYNTQIAMGLRQRRTPADFLNQLYISAGNQQYYNRDRPVYYQAILQSAGLPAAVAAQAARQGLTAAELRQAKAQGDSTAITSAWTNYLQAFQAQHPVWAADFNNSGTAATRRVQTIAQLQEIYSKGLAPKSPQAEQMKSLLDSYDEYHAAYTAGRADDWASFSSTDLKNAWQAYLTSVSTKFPLLAGAIHSVFLEAT